MAQCIRFVCDNCSKAIEAWSDGNPYYIDEAGSKQYAYHPDHDRLARCIGNDSPHLCLACGEEFLVDSRVPIGACPKCEAKEIVDLCRLGGRRCPYCKSGEFHADPDFHCVS
jgi:predicted RNA-binding Zn-ribbon protein involved in translation (DUF1610 family)